MPPNYAQYEDKQFIRNRLEKIIGDPSVFSDGIGHLQSYTQCTFKEAFWHGLYGSKPYTHFKIETGELNKDLEARLQNICQRLLEFFCQMGNDLGYGVKKRKISKDKMLQIAEEVFHQMMFYNRVPLAEIAESVVIQRELDGIVEIHLPMEGQ